jgi:hypothetical protein
MTNAFLAGYAMGMLTWWCTVKLANSRRRISKRGCNKRFSVCLDCKDNNRCDRYAQYRKRLVRRLEKAKKKAEAAYCGDLIRPDQT